jgi:hypothetical protein
MNKKERVISGIKSQNEPAEWEGRQGFWVQGDCVFVEASEPVAAINKYREELAAAKIACSHNLFCGDLTPNKVRGANYNVCLIDDFKFVDNSRCLFPVEDNQGNIKQTSYQDFHITGYVPNWQQAKEQVAREGVSSLGLVGFFMNPSGVTTDSSRFSHYLNQEKDTKNKRDAKQIVEDI